MNIRQLLTNRRVRTGFYVFVIANFLISGSTGFNRANVAYATPQQSIEGDLPPGGGGGGGSTPVTICHATGSQSNPWTQLHTTEGAQLFNGHFENSGTPLHGHEEDLLLQGTVNCPDAGPYCSDGNIDTGLGEQCDDKNLIDGDGCDVECLIETGILIVKKVLTNDNGGNSSAGNFSFSIDSGSPIVFESDGQNEVTVPSGVTHTVAEVADSGYATTYDNCTDVTVPKNGIATCTITNDDQPGTLIIKKVVVNDKGGTANPEDFSFTVDEGDNISFESDGENQMMVDAGTYTVIENLNSGYTLSDVSCVYENQSVGQSVNNGKEVTIDNGDTVTCTFTNTFTPPLPTEGTLIVKKLVLDGGETDDPSDFSIHVLDDGSDVASSPQSGSGTGTSYILQAGAYQVQEQGPVSNWQVAYGNDDNCASDGDITVVAGETVTCTVINTFVPTPSSTFTLNLTKSGPGKGGVDNDKENGTWCDENCAENAHTYAAGTVVTLTANPSSGSSFEGSWSGACNGTGTCVVTMNSNQTVNAHFSLQSIPPPPCTENCGGGGGGGGGGYSPLTVFNEKNETVALPDSTVSWFTNVSATCTAVYDDASHETFGNTYPFGYDSQVPAGTGNGTYHTATLTGLTTGVTYYWRPNCSTTGGSSQTAVGQQLTIALVESPVVLGYQAPAQPAEDDVKVLGFEILPKTGGDLSDYYAALAAIFGTVLLGLYLGYRRTERV